jgi:hypothetical protein
MQVSGFSDSGPVHPSRAFSRWNSYATTFGQFIRLDFVNPTCENLRLVFAYTGWVFAAQREEF